MVNFKQCVTLTLILIGLGSEIYAGSDSRSLVFNDSNPDDMNFLATHSPNLVGKSHNLLPISDISAYPVGGEVYDLREQAVVSAVSGLQTAIQDAERIGRITNPELTPLLDFHSQEKAALRENHDRLSFEKFLGGQLESARTLAGDIMLAACQIYHYAQGAPILFLGRSPCLVQVAYEEFLRHRGERQPIYHLSFSGTPDTLNLRTAEDYLVVRKNILRNIVTPERLKFFEDLMTEKGLHLVTGKIYLVDMISTGGSLNSFLRLFRHYYTQTLKQEMPDVEFLGMNLTYDFPHGFQNIWRYVGTEGTLRFNGIPSHGICPLTIRTRPIVLNPFTIVRALDNDSFQCAVVHGVELPAQRWTEKSRAALQRGGELHQEFYQLARPIFAETAAHYNQAYRIWNRIWKMMQPKTLPEMG